MNDSTITRLIGLALVATLAGCGGSGGSGPTSQPPPPSAIAKTTVGQISGFGSIYVNGVEYDTTGATYVVDDTIASSDSALAVGMVVNVQGSVNPDGKTGSAESVSYDDDIEGIVEDLATDPDDMNIKTFVVMGTSIQATRNHTNFEGEDDPDFSFDTIMNGDNVEVSGDYSHDILFASYIEEQDADDDEFEAKGTVDEYNLSNQFVLVLRNGSSLNVTLDDGAEIPDAGIMDDQYVEVEGTIPDPVNAPDSILASKVEIEDEDRIDGDDEDEVEIKGILTYNADTVSWSVKDVQLAFGDNTEYSPETLEDGIADYSADGLYVEVEGQYVDEVLQVREIEIEEDNLEFKADVDSVTVMEPRDGSLVLSFGNNVTGTVEVRVTPDTMFLDDEAMDHFDLNSIMDKVEIEARMGDDGIIYASSLHLEDDMGYEIKGPVVAIDEVSINVMGVVFTLDNMVTFFENGRPVAGDFVEVEDDDADGIADSVEIED